MSFIISVLQGMGLLAQIRVTEAPKANPFTAAPEGAPMRRVSLSELTAKDAEQSAEGELAALRDSAGMTLSLRDIFRMGKLEEPKHGVTIVQLAEMARTLAKAKGAQAAADELTIEIAAVGMTLEDAVADAVRHDEMLDLYDEAVGIRVERLVDEMKAEEQRLAAEIERLQARLVTRRERAEELRGAYQNWRRHKRTIEQGWADALALLVDKDVVSVTDLERPAGSATPSGKEAAQDRDASGAKSAEAASEPDEAGTVAAEPAHEDVLAEGIAMGKSEGLASEEPEGST